MNKKYSLRQFCIAGLFAAIIFVATAYFPRVPTINGYAHVGDAFIFICASILPAPLAIAASALGGSLADLLTGYAIWVPATAIIKAATAAFFTSKKPKLLCMHNFIAIAMALVLCVGGYYLFEALVIAGNFGAPIASIPANIGQWLASTVIYVIIAIVLDKTPKLKKYLERNWH